VLIPTLSFGQHSVDAGVVPGYAATGAGDTASTLSQYTAFDSSSDVPNRRSIDSWGCEEVTLWLKSEAGEWAGQYREKLCALSVG
jgi:hypothetical protein